MPPPRPQVQAAHLHTAAIHLLSSRRRGGPSSCRSRSPYRPCTAPGHSRCPVPPSPTAPKVASWKHRPLSLLQSAVFPLPCIHRPGPQTLACDLPAPQEAERAKELQEQEARTQAIIKSEAVAAKPKAGPSLTLVAQDAGQQRIAQLTQAFQAVTEATGACPCPACTRPSHQLGVVDDKAKSSAWCD